MQKDYVFENEGLALTPGSREEAEYHITKVLNLFGYSPEGNEHLQDTPKRYIKMLEEMLIPQETWKLTTFPSVTAGQPISTDSGIILQHDIPFNSMCAHHMCPFSGTATIGYIPDDRIVGLSKLARLVQQFSVGLRTQEGIGTDIADFMMKELAPKGVAVYLNAGHTCMTMRGIKAHGTTTTTETLRGVFFTTATARSEFLSLLMLNRR